MPTRRRRRRRYNDTHDNNTWHNVRKFRQDKELHPQPGGSTAIRRFGVKAQNFVPLIGCYHVPQPRCRAGKSNGGKGRQGKIPGRQNVPPVPSIALGKIFLPGHNQGAVQDTKSQRNDGMIHHPISDRYGIVIGFPTIVFF